jgi:hypothetical protein
MNHMNRSTNHYLVFSGIVAAASGLLHVATIFGGPTWYRMIGAPEAIVRLASQGHLYPVLVCLLAAAVLFACSVVAFSGARLIRRVPFLRTALVLITFGVLVHGVAFIPLVMQRPDLMTSVYDGNGVNTILVVTSIVCLVTGTTFALGTRQAWRHLRPGTD